MSCSMIDIYDLFIFFFNITIFLASSTNRFFGSIIYWKKNVVVQVNAG